MTAVVLSYGRAEEGRMGFTGAGEPDAAPGLRTAVGIYSGKTDRALARISELEAELADLRVEAAKYAGTRDQLSEALAELLADRSAPSADDQSPQRKAGAEYEDSDASPSDESNASEPSEETRAGQSGPSRSPSGQLMQAVEQILVSAGRPMKARDITEALGRPTKGDEGRAPIETTRATCKRLVKNGRAVEHPIGVFAARRVTKTQGGDA
ncbi:hypothetical protein R2B67_21495 [Streptomyces cyaneofuscatus]|uniref:hypothetical protein n=1 Tax=Streptomyces cyaneofuscatus TaxID=66883 RepID=UPI0029557F19|nr:hypothetical protein [Streptomyces cyaneofuscatus]WOP10947.1 hypothetical protein R2B67_21495 [Streptomyces cyaneofuscatus]